MWFKQDEAVAVAVGVRWPQPIILEVDPADFVPKGIIQDEFFAVVGQSVVVGFEEVISWEEIDVSRGIAFAKGLPVPGQDEFLAGAEKL